MRKLGELTTLKSSPIDHRQLSISLQRDRRHGRMGRKQNSCRDDTAMSLRAAVLLAALCLLGGAAVVARGQLTDDFYDGCCPQAEDIVKARVSAAMKTEFRMGASLLRLHFHDCFVNGVVARLKAVIKDTNSLLEFYYL